MVLDFIENIEYDNTYNIIDKSGKVYDFMTNKIYFDDNIDTVVEKIAYNCNSDITIDEIYVWYNYKNVHKSLYFDYVSNPSIVYKNPLNDIPDDNFLDDENFSSKTTIYNKKCINNIDITDNNIYYITIYELIDNSKNIDSIYINGLIKKYFPNLNDKDIQDFIEKKKPTKKKIDSIKKQKKCLSLIDKQCDFVYDKNLKGDTDGFRFEFIKINNDDNKNGVNIVKIFAKLNTSLEIPFIKLFLNDYTESYYKLYDMYYKKNIVDSDKILSWIKSKPLIIKESLYYIPQKNTLTIYFKYDNIYFRIMIGIDGNLSLIVEDNIDSKKLNMIINICNNFVKKYINDMDIYSVEDIRYIEFEWSKKHIYDNNIELLNYNLYFHKTDNFDKKTYINFINNLYCYFRPINERTSIKSDVFYYIFKRVNDYDEKNIEELLYYKYRNPPYDLDDNTIIKKISDDLLTKDNDLENRIVTYRENYNNNRRYNKNSNGPEITISFDTNNIVIRIDSVKSIDEYYRLYKIFTNINTIYNDNSIEKDEYISKNKNLNFYKQKCINVVEDIIVEGDSANDSSDDDIDEDLLRFVEMDEDIESSNSSPPTVESDKSESPPTVESNNSNSSPPSIESDDLEQSGRGYSKQNGGGENLDRYYSKRLKDYDKKLFNWSGKDKDGKKRIQYSRDCQTYRQPIVVTDEELKRINMSEDLGSGRNSYKNSMKYGSDPNHQFNYICPEYWDTKNNLSLDPKSDKWDRDMIVSDSEKKNTDKTILHRTGDFFKIYPLAVKDANVKNPDLDLPVPCCFNNIVKDINVETNVITQNTLCFKNYCKLSDNLNTYLNFDNKKDDDKIYLKKGIGEHSILDAIIHTLNITEIINTDEMLKDSNIDNDYIETFFDDIKVKNKIYTSDILDYDIVKYNILNYFKIKTFDKSLKISILKYSLLLSYFEKIKNTKYDDFDRNVIRKCIDIEKNNFNKEKCIICKFQSKGKEIIGVVEKITPKNYRICCKPDTNYYDKSANLWSMNINEASEKCTEYDSEEKCKEYNIDLNDIQNGIEYFNTILNNIDSVYNSFVLYIKRYIFRNKLIEFVKSNDFSKSGNGYIIDKFKKYKKNITSVDIEKYNKYYNKNYSDIDDMYKKFEKDLESYNSFNVFTASQKYIEYLETKKHLDDIYILPIMQSYLKSLGKNIYTIVFEDIENECCIKNQYYNLNDNNEYIFFYKNGKNYEPICFKNGKVYEYLFKSKDIKFVIDDIIKNDNKKSYLIDAKTTIKNFDIVGGFVNNNFMTHLITKNNIFIPIQKCFIEDIDLNLVFDIKNIDLPDYKDIKKFYKNPLLKNYIPENIIIENETYTLVFSNKSYIPTKKSNFDIKIIEGKNLLELDKQICLQNIVLDKNLEYINNIDILIENIEEYIGYMLVEFKNKNKRYLDIKNINDYKIGNKYKGETITNILTTDILQNIGIIYTYDSILKDIDNILKNTDLDMDKKHIELYNRLKDISDKNIKKCKNIELIKKEKLSDVFLYRFIELLCIYGINKSDKKNIYNCQKDIELHLLHMTSESDETFLPYDDDIVEMVESLYDNDNIY